MYLPDPQSNRVLFACRQPSLTRKILICRGSLAGRLVPTYSFANNGPRWLRPHFLVPYHASGNSLFAFGVHFNVFVCLLLLLAHGTATRSICWLVTCVPTNQERCVANFDGVCIAQPRPLRRLNAAGNQLQTTVPSHTHLYNEVTRILPRLSKADARMPSGDDIASLHQSEGAALTEFRLSSPTKRGIPNPDVEITIDEPKPLNEKLVQLGGTKDDTPQVSITDANKSSSEPKKKRQKKNVPDNTGTFCEVVL